MKLSKVCLILTAALMSFEAHAAIELHHLSGRVVEMDSLNFSVRAGNTVFEFEREQGDRDLPKSLKIGDTVSVAYQTDADHERVGNLVVKRTSSRSEAGQLGVPGHILKNDRVFYGA